MFCTGERNLIDHDNFWMICKVRNPRTTRIAVRVNGVLERYGEKPYEKFTDAVLQPGQTSEIRVDFPNADERPNTKCRCSVQVDE